MALPTPVSAVRSADGMTSGLESLARSLMRRAGFAGGSFAVIDIGSNSVRLVVFDGLKLAPVPMFNEKAIIGLGRGLATDNRLADGAVAEALACLERYVTLARSMGVSDLEVIATAAVRDAENGVAFKQEIEARCDVDVRIISGEEEARLSALGVLSGIPDASGVMGDLGGGSLELVSLDPGTSGRGPALNNHATLPIGPLRVIEDAARRKRSPRDLIKEKLDTLPWLDKAARGRAFYPVGGAWRSLAKVHIAQTRYPLHVIQGYTVARDDVLELTRLVSGMSKASLSAMKGISRRRVEVMPVAALILEQVLRLIDAREVVFSAYGLREGLMYARLSDRERTEDPLLSLAREEGARAGRFGGAGDALVAWTDSLDPSETATSARLRRALCHLSDMGWRIHPDYRAELAFRHMLLGQLPAVTHAERAHLAVGIHARYGGESDDPVIEPATRLLDSAAVRRAVFLGRVMRLAYAYSGAVGSLIAGTRLSMGGGTLRLQVPGTLGASLAAAQVDRRLESAAEVLELRPVLEVMGPVAA